MLSSASRTEDTAGCRQDLPKSATTSLSFVEIADDRHLVGLDSKLFALEHTSSAVAYSRAAQKYWRSAENLQSASERRTKKT